MIRCVDEARAPSGWSLFAGFWGTLIRRPGSGPRILFLPGLGCPAGQYTEHASRWLPPEWDLWVWEAPGSGATPFLADRQGTLDELSAQLGRALVQFERTIHAASWILVAHSMGGIVGLRLSEELPGLICGFVSVEGNLGPEDCMFTSRVVKRGYLRFRTQWLPRTAEDLSSSENPGDRDYARTLRSLGSPRAYYLLSHSTVSASRGSALLERFASLDLPRLYVHGDGSGAAATIARVTELGCAVMTVPSSGHFPHIDRPRLFYERIRHFALRISRGCDE